MVKRHETKHDTNQTRMTNWLIQIISTFHQVFPNAHVLSPCRMQPWRSRIRHAEHDLPVASVSEPPTSHMKKGLVIAPNSVGRSENMQLVSLGTLFSTHLWRAKPEQEGPLPCPCASSTERAESIAAIQVWNHAHTASQICAKFFDLSKPSADIVLSPMRAIPYNL